MSYRVNDIVRIRGKVVQLGKLTDPDSLTLTITDPAATVTTLTYGVDDELVRDSAGNYSYVLQFALPGIYSAVWEGDGTSTVTGTVVFSVEATPQLVNFLVQDGTPAPIQGVRVSVSDDDGGDLVGNALTNSSGVASVKLLAGTYTVTAEKRGWRFTPSNITVVGTTPPPNEQFTLSGTNLDIDPDATVEHCLLYGYLVDSSGRGPGEGVRVFVGAVGGDVVSFVDQGGSGLDRRSIGVLQGQREVIPDVANGYWEIDLVRGMMVKVHIPHLKFQRIFRVPDQDTLNIKDARPDPGPATMGLTSSNN